uniref:Glucose-1-phosphate thymidylyltransferase n=1 Tax=Caldimicrobium thiodismutans TaxID=1653476 RepID=A0A832GQJ4_9BACT
MKAVILAGGSGTRLYPVTQNVNKHLLSIYNKPMIYYPISLAMLIGIRDIIFVITPQDEEIYRKFFVHLRKIGLNVDYVIQEKPRGLAEGLILVREKVKKEPIFYLLGDNILFGHGLSEILKEAKQFVEEKKGAYVFGYYVPDPERFGVVEFDKEGKVLSIEEKPKKPKSNYAIIGIYFFDERATDFALKVKPSKRGELEITSVLEEYLKEQTLRVKLLGRGFAWFDAGTHESFLEASEFVHTIEKRTGLMIGCIEEIAYRNGWIDADTLLSIAKVMSKTYYGEYLLSLVSKRCLG